MRNTLHSLGNILDTGARAFWETWSKSLFEGKKQRGTLVYIVSCNWTLCALSGHKADPKKHVLIMDEVDGMAGNEDRGGMQVRMIVNCRLQNGVRICS